MIMVKIKANVHAEDQWCSLHKVHPGPWESCIMYTKCIRSRVSLSTLDWPLINMQLTSRLKVHWHLGRQSVDSWLIFSWCIHVHSPLHTLRVYNAITFYHRPAMHPKGYSYIALSMHCIPVTLSLSTIGLQYVQNNLSYRALYILHVITKHHRSIVMHAKGLICT